MGQALVTNNAAATLASSITNSAVSLVLTAGNGALFPNPTGGDFFYGTLIDSSNNKEIVKVTARSTDTLTIVRGQDGTTGRAYSANDRFELRFCAAVHACYAQLGKAQIFSASVSILNDTYVTGAAASERTIHFRTALLDRWTILAGNAAESGSNVGSDFLLRCYADDGATKIADAIKIARATGIMTVLAGFKIGSDAADHFATGIAMPFRQPAVAVGWTKDTTFNDAALRVVSGTPGSRVVSGNEVTSLFTATRTPTGTVGGHAITIDEMPSHRHTTDVDFSSQGTAGGGGPSSVQGGTRNTSLVGGGSQHTHGWTGDALNFAINYVDLYIAVKN